MAEKKIVAAELQFKSDEAQKNVFKLTGNVKDLRKAVNEAVAGSEEQLAAHKKLIAAEKELAAATDVLTTANKALEKSQEDLGKSGLDKFLDNSAAKFGKLKEGLGQLPGPFGTVGESATGLSSSLKALLANPVVLVIAAIVVVLAALAKAFASTRKGADLIGQGMAAVSGAIEKAVQIVGDFITSITSVGDLMSKIGKFFSNPIKTIKEFGAAVADAAVQSANLKKAQQDLERDKVNNLARNKELIQQEEALKNIRDNEFNSTKERIDANEKASALEKERLKTLEDLQLREVDRLQKLIALKGGEAKATTDELKELREAQLELADIREESIGRENEFLTNRYSLQKEAADKEKELRDKAAEEEKNRLANLLEYTNKLRALQQENFLATVTDGYLKEATALRYKIAQEKEANEQALKEKKINQEQLIALNEELDEQLNRQERELQVARDKERKDQEKEFQKELSDLKIKTRQLLAPDEAQKEIDELKKSYDEQLAAAAEKYKDNTERLEKIKTAIDEQYRAEKAAAEKKIKDAENKASYEEKLAKQDKILSDQNASLESQKAALDQEQAIFVEAYKNKVLTLEEYNEKYKTLTDKRKAIAELETKHRNEQFQYAADVLNQFSDLIGKNTVAGKVAAIAATTINTYQAAWSIFANASKNPATIPFPAYPYIQAGVAIVAGLKTVNDIIKVKTPSGAAAGSAPSATGIAAPPAAPIAPTQTSTSIDQSSINGIGNAAAGGINGIRAYVVEQDSAEAAARAARLRGASVLGG